MRWPRSNPTRSTSGACVTRSPNSKHRVPDYVCRITSRCSRRCMRKPGALRRGWQPSTRRSPKRAPTTSAGGTRSYTGCEASYCSCAAADASDVEAAFLHAIEIAQSQQARSLELRATMSLARLWNAQHRSNDARHRLQDIYGWFTEGFETPDLQAARLLLEQL